MKNIIQLITVVAFLIGGLSNVQAQKKEIITTEFQVTGVCKMCKKRIENAAYIKGVKMVEWNKEEQQLKVVYRNDKVSEEEIHTAVANAGHDTETTKASDEAYNELPGCCAYRDGVEVH